MKGRIPREELLLTARCSYPRLRRGCGNEVAFTIHSSPSNTFWQAVKKGLMALAQRFGLMPDDLHPNRGVDWQRAANMQAAIA
jgi:hypothetical protein